MRSVSWIFQAFIMMVNVSKYDYGLVILFHELERKAILPVYSPLPDSIGSLHSLDVQGGMMQIVPHQSQGFDRFFLNGLGQGTKGFFEAFGSAKQH